MAIKFLAREVSELCLGKPALRSLPISSTVADALSALKRSGDIYLSIWSCDHSSNNVVCKCVGKLCMVDVICFLTKQENPLDALQSPISDILPKLPGIGIGIVKHLEPNSSLLEAIDQILDGAQNLVIPIKSYNSRKKLIKKPSTLHNGRECCWLTQEDIVRFLLTCINAFSPIPTLTIESVNIIQTQIMTIHYNSPASSLLSSISQSHLDQTSIAVIDDDNRLIGEISPFTLACCDETVAAAITTLSAGDLMAYVDFGGPPEDLVQLVKMRLQERNLCGMLELMEEFSFSTLSSSSSDEEFGAGRKYSPARRSEAITCHRGSSLMAVMIQALAHRVTSVWVVEEDYSLVGIVTFTGILEVFRSIAGVKFQQIPTTI